MSEDVVKKTNKRTEAKGDDPASQVLCHRVTELRKQNKLTLDQLAAASGVSRSMLSQIERGQANPTLAVTFRIAQAFGISIGELVDQPWASSTIEVVHGDDPNNLFRADDECQIRTLSPLHMEKNIEFYELTLAPGASLSSAPHYEGTKELLTVSQGQASIVSGESNSQLQTGDTAHYRADLTHVIKNVGRDTLMCYLVVTSK
ncbi:MAG: DNA-binding protein [Cellvibrionaceae bacterium]|nr:DNA-binding protein [Cellvibrionaceae bacterium]|tara:strand:- start:44590 stop:45198 length:609 start_codon:yes stop_codon:yes gene_type:complete